MSQTATRPRYATKADWADAQAAAIRELAYRMRREPAGGVAGTLRKYDNLDRLDAEASRWEGIAARLRRQGQ